MTASDWHRGDWMQTYSGRKFYPLDPRPEDIDPVDIAHALSLLCRYNGHVDRFYSVAEHCLLMSQTFDDPFLARWALLHDATEAYVGDMIRPLKLSMKKYRRAEDRVMLAICERFDLPFTYGFIDSPGVPRVAQMPALVKEADSRILLTERAALLKAPPEAWAMDDLEPLDVEVEGLAPYVAEGLYLHRLAYLGLS